MFIEFVEQFRCPSNHESTWLVAAFTHREDRFIIDAMLGCHICLRQYPIVDGIAYFGRTPSPLPPRPFVSSETDDAVRIAAFLNVTERSTCVLGGLWAAHAHHVAVLMPLRLIALDPMYAMEDSEQVAICCSSVGIPLAPLSVDGVALDATTASDVNIRTALQVLRSGGRLVAPVTTDVPAEVTVLAQDASVWVAEVRPELTALRRGAPLG